MRLGAGLGGNTTRSLIVPGAELTHSGSVFAASRYAELRSLSLATLSCGSPRLLILYSNWPSLSGNCAVTSYAPRAASRLKVVDCKNTLRPSLNLCAVSCVDNGGGTSRMRLPFARHNSSMIEHETFRLKGWLGAQAPSSPSLNCLDCAVPAAKSSK